MNRWLQSRRVRWLAYLCGWTLFGLFLTSQDIFHDHALHHRIDITVSLVMWMTEAYLWALLAPLVWLLSKRWPMGSHTWRRSAFAHLICGVILAVVEAILFSLAFSLLVHRPDETFSATLHYVLPIDFHFNLVIYSGIVAAQHIAGMYRRYQEQHLHASELQRQLVQSRLAALRAQLQPHFLFNTLNAIVVLVRQQKTREADEMITNLSELLRQTLEEWEMQEVPLRKEIEFLKLYLDIEQVRFQDCLKVEIAIDPETLDSLVPCFLLQPLVENAIRHGIAKSSSAGKLTIKSRRVDSMLEIQICDDGPGFSDNQLHQCKGTGLTNTKARLRELYGEQQSLRLENSGSGGATATITLSWREEGCTQP